MGKALHEGRSRLPCLTPEGPYFLTLFLILLICLTEMPNAAAAFMLFILPSKTAVITPYRLTSSVMNVTPFFTGAPPLGAPYYRQG